MPAHQLAASVRMVAAGEALLAPSIRRRLIDEFASAPEAAPSPRELDQLTLRELEVFRLAGSVEISQPAGPVHVGVVSPAAQLAARSSAAARALSTHAGRLHLRPSVREETLIVTAG